MLTWTFAVWCVGEAHWHYLFVGHSFLFVIMLVFTTCLQHPTGETCLCEGGCGNSGITSADGNEGEWEICIFWFHADVEYQIECGYHNVYRWPGDMFLVLCLPKNQMHVHLSAAADISKSNCPILKTFTAQDWVFFFFF